ncbi:MAG: hypothetical protein FWB74_10350, partial [Defluviitaleaceae bacterium]|nr:hypothetical protein [Defluviitaleaceae bacterium]
GVSGLMFAAVTALCAQLSASARSVKGYAFLVLLVFYLLRAVGDVNNETVAMVSPLGLILRALPFYENNLIPIFLVLFFAVILTAMAFRLCARRDIGQGIIPARAGRPFAKKYMTTLFGHTWRISRGTLISWAIGMFVFGAVFGLVIGDVEVFTAEAEWFAAMMPPNADFTLTEMFTALLNTFLVLFAAVPALILVLKLRAEEKAGRTEMLISTAVTRQSHMAGFVALAVIAALIMPFLGMISMWLFSIPVLDEPMNLRGLAQAVMSFVPAIGVTVGLVAAVAGWLPRLVSFVWGYYGFVFVSGFFGTMLSLPEWLMSLSPFHHIPQMPMDSWQTAPVVILSITAIALTIFGIWGYSRRDIA